MTGGERRGARGDRVDDLIIQVCPGGSTGRSGSAGPCGSAKGLSTDPASCREIGTCEQRLAIKGAVSCLTR